MRILILSASTGGGHLRASSALKSYILKNDKTAIVEIVDTLKYISPILNKTVTEGYEQLAKKSPKVYGAMYKTTNKDHFKSFVVAFNRLFSKKLIPLLNQFKPDIIISTHPFPTEMVSNLKGNKSMSIPLVCVMTDYAPHKTWINENVDAYIVSNDDMVALMENMGVKKELIHPYGIPIEDLFHFSENKKEILSELNLSQDMPTILIMAGSFGVNDILKIYNNIVEIDLDFQIIVITGRNRKLYFTFEKVLNKEQTEPLHTISKVSKVLSDKIQSSLNINTLRKKSKTTKLVYFTNEVHKYMQTADLIITKPGGLTISEALACNLPMAIFNAIPGQEEENAEFLIDNNMAVKLGKNSTCAKTIEDLLLDKNKLNDMKASCENFDKSSSSKKVLALIRELVDKRGNTEDSKSGMGEL